MRSYRIGKCEREDKTGHEKYDIRLLLKKKQKEIIIVSELSKLAREHLDWQWRDLDFKQVWFKADHQTPLGLSDFRYEMYGLNYSIFEISP